MNASEIQQVRVQLANRQRRNHKRPGWMTRLARKSGWAAITLRQFKNNTYHGNNELIAETLKAIFEKTTAEARRGR